MAQEYKTMDSDEKQELWNKNAQEYKTMDSATKQEILERQQNYCICKNKTVYSCIEEFNRKIKEGSYHSCCMCNSTLYKKSLKTQYN